MFLTDLFVVRLVCLGTFTAKLYIYNISRVPVDCWQFFFVLFFINSNTSKDSWDSSESSTWASRPKLRISIKKILFTEKIIYLSILSLKMPPMAQKPAFLTYLMIFLFNKVIYKNICGVLEAFCRL